MSKPKHIHYDIILKWAEGEDVEVFKEHSWKWEVVHRPAFHADRKYRVAPKKHMYKRYLMYSTVLMHDSTQLEPVVCCAQWSERDSKNPESCSNFIKWIDTDWQTVEF